MRRTAPRRLRSVQLADRRCNLTVEIQVHLEGRSRLLVFEADSDETLVLAPAGRRPFAEQDANNPCTGPLTIGEEEALVLPQCKSPVFAETLNHIARHQILTAGCCHEFYEAHQRQCQACAGTGLPSEKASGKKRGKPAGENSADPLPRKTPRFSARASASRGVVGQPPPPPPPPPRGALLKQVQPCQAADQLHNMTAPGIVMLRLEPETGEAAPSRAVYSPVLKKCHLTVNWVCLCRRPLRWHVRRQRSRRLRQPPAELTLWSCRMPSRCGHTNSCWHWTYPGRTGCTATSVYTSKRAQHSETLMPCRPALLD